MVEIPATGQHFRRNSNFIKPRQSKQNSYSTRPQLIQNPLDPPAAVPSSQATSTVDTIPTVPPALQNKNSTPRVTRTNRGVPPTRLGLQE